MEPIDAVEFAAAWATAWNEHDLEAVLEHFAEDVTFTSPLAAEIVPGSGGVIRGKAQLHAYWSEGLRRQPDLRFEVEGVYLGVGSLVIHYRNQRGGLVCEVLRFEGALVTNGDATYLAVTAPANQSNAPSGGIEPPATNRAVEEIGERNRAE